MASKSHLLNRKRGRSSEDDNDTSSRSRKRQLSSGKMAVKMASSSDQIVHESEPPSSSADESSCDDSSGASSSDDISSDENSSDNKSSSGESSSNESAQSTSNKATKKKGTKPNTASAGGTTQAKQVKSTKAEPKHNSTFISPEMGADRAATFLALTDPAPATSSAPYHEMNDLVIAKVRDANGDLITRGGVVEARGWSNLYDSYIYALCGGESWSDFSYSCGATGSERIGYEETMLETAAYDVGDVVRVRAFGTESVQTIKQAYLSDDGIFTYKIAEGLHVRDEDICAILTRKPPS